MIKRRILGTSLTLSHGLFSLHNPIAWLRIFFLKHRLVNNLSTQTPEASRLFVPVWPDRLRVYLKHRTYSWFPISALQLPIETLVSSNTLEIRTGNPMATYQFRPFIPFHARARHGCERFKVRFFYRLRFHDSRILLFLLFGFRESVVSITVISIIQCH